jgi:hypothetical protein
MSDIAAALRRIIPLFDQTTLKIHHALAEFRGKMAAC